MRTKRHALSIGFLVYSLTLITSILSTNANAASLTINPSSNMGNSIAQLQPGDVLTLTDGNYSPIFINCGSNAQNGTASQPITIRAQNERQAHIVGTGNTVFQMENCAYWVIQGLHVSNIDIAVSGFEGSGIVFELSDHITVARNLIYGPNAYFNSHGIALYNTNNSLVEENEVYYATRHGIIQGWDRNQNTPTGNIIRRNYLHSRGHGLMPGGFTCPGSCENNRGDEGISLYPAKNAIIENNIVEDFGGAFTGQCKADCGNNRYYGNIALTSGGFSFGVRSEVFQNTAEQMPTNEYYENNLVYQQDTWNTFSCRTCKNTQYLNNSAITNIADSNGTGFLGVLWDLSCGCSCGEGGDTCGGGGSATNFATNMLLMSMNGAAFDVSNISQWSVNHVRSFNNAASNPPLNDGHYANVSTNDPNMGSCLVFIPANSNLKGAGAGGVDIGANILYRYQNGVLTTTPLWDPTTSRFPCGAQIAGVNDIAGSSCFDVHTRLNVNTNGCTLPTTPTTVTLPAPTNLRLLVSQP